MKKITLVLFCASLIGFFSCNPAKDSNEKNNSTDSSAVNGALKDSLLDEIAKAEKKLFADKMAKADHAKGIEAIKAYTNFINQFPTDEKTPDYLFKAGEVSSALYMSEPAIAYFENVYTKFPKHPKAQFALFLQGFIYENQLMNLEKAKAKYEEVIAKYPNTQQSKDAEACIQNLGKSPEQLIREFEAKNKK